MRLALCACLLALAAALAPVHAGGDPSDTTSTAAPAEAGRLPRVVFVVSRYQGRTAAWWARRARGWHARARALHRTLIHDSSVAEALNLACTAYGGCSTLWRRARCESTLDPGAVNGHRRYLLSADSAAGLLQFKPSTWRTTPYRRFSIFSPYASALAAGWMSTRGRGGEWACR